MRAKSWDRPDARSPREIPPSCLHPERRRARAAEQLYDCLIDRDRTEPRGSGSAKGDGAVVETTEQLDPRADSAFAEPRAAEHLRPLRFRHRDRHDVATERP